MQIVPSFLIRLERMELASPIGRRGQHRFIDRIYHTSSRRPASFHLPFATRWTKYPQLVLLPAIYFTIHMPIFDTFTLRPHYFWHRKFDFSLRPGEKMHTPSWPPSAICSHRHKSSECCVCSLNAWAMSPAKGKINSHHGSSTLAPNTTKLCCRCGHLPSH